MSPLPCFASDTRIMTVHGEIAVEDLAIGDLAVTACGTHRPIRWIGHRTLSCGNHARPEEVRPIRIARHAFGENKPLRDLYVSPGHAICVDILGEVLIPAGALVNGTTITQVETDQFTYWHVELDSHDVLIANGLQAESYLEMENRDFFVGSDIVAFGASPDANVSDPAERAQAEFCLPYINAGPILDAVRMQLRRRAEAIGWTLDKSHSFADLHLVVDGMRINPVMRGLTARFSMPAGARDVWLVSAASRPCDIGLGEDIRCLGISLSGLTIDDGSEEPRVIPVDDPLLCAGFHEVEAYGRWTAGRARLPAALWDRCRDDFFLCVELLAPALARWVAPPALLAASSEQLPPGVGQMNEAAA